jgi:DNA-binding transcriptional LysR family regulator
LEVAVIDEIPGDLLQWLRGFYFVAQRGGVTRATEVMGREQPTITRQIKCLEKELGVTLFDRSSGVMKLTIEGKALLAKAVNLFEDVKEMRSEFRNEELEQQGKIVIAASYTIIDSFLPRYVVAFRASHPAVTFHMEGGVFEIVFEKVESAEADFGITYIESVPATLVCYDLFESRLKLIAPKGHAFFAGDSPTLEEIARAPLILFSHTGSIETFIERRFAEDHLKPNVIMTHNNFVSVKRYVALGMGIALLSGYAFSEEDEKVFQILSLDQYFPKRKYGLLLRKKKYLPPAVKAFIHRIKPDIQLGTV